MHHSAECPHFNYTISDYILEYKFINYREVPNRHYIIHIFFIYLVQSNLVLLLNPRANK
uniref:Uncharacterized protein n=1 Tax=Kalanchoe fedtschenkoi TaxID=63787 RepID=A0A7N0UY11_KALFE